MITLKYNHRPQIVGPGKSQAEHEAAQQLAAGTHPHQLKPVRKLTHSREIYADYREPRSVADRRSGPVPEITQAQLLAALATPCHLGDLRGRLGCSESSVVRALKRFRHDVIRDGLGKQGSPFVWRRVSA